MPLSQLERVETNLRKLGKQMPQVPIIESLIVRAAIILGRDTNALLDRLLRPAGLAEPEFRVLMSLLAHGGTASAGDLCAALAQSPANLTRIGDALVKRGYIRRDTDLSDRRRMLLTLLPKGRRFVDEMLPGVCEEITALFAGFTSTEKKQMLQGFRRLLAGIEALDAPDAASDDDTR